MFDQATGLPTALSNSIRGTYPDKQDNKARTTATSAQEGRLKVDVASKNMKKKKRKIVNDIVNSHRADQVGYSGTRPFNGRKPDELKRSKELKTDLVAPLQNRKYDSPLHSSSTRLHD